MTIATTFIPDAFLIWLWKYSLRTGAVCIALSIIAFLLSLVFRAIAAMIDAFHSALHSIVLLCLSINHTFVSAGLLGQLVILCLVISGFIWFFSHVVHRYIIGGRS